MSTARSLRVSEIFESIQGEGATAGAPSVFLRLAACNLKCAWCDTKYTWDWSQFRYENEVTEWLVAAVAERLLPHAARHLVVTGGEPLLQQPALAALFALLPLTQFVEVETNGTLAPSSALVERVDQWNVSPKLGGSGESRERRLNTDALGVLRRTDRAWLKLVLSDDLDREEAVLLIERIRWPKERVLFMPEAATRETLSERAPLVAKWAERHGVGVSPRLHVEKWNGARGV